MEEKKLFKVQVILQNLLKEERRKRNMSQQDIANATGFTQSTISKYESGERRLDLLELMIICQALDKPVLDFVAELENRIKVSFT